MAKSQSTTPRRRARVAAKKTKIKKPLVRSRAKAEREIAGLDRGRKRIESTPTLDDTSARATLF
jgi:hypothetical protein